MFTPQILEALSAGKASGRTDGPATLVVPDGDILYLVNGSWTLVLAEPETYVAPALLEWIRNVDTTPRWGLELPDCRVLAASRVDFRAGKFLPMRSPEYADILQPAYVGYSNYNPDTIRDSVEHHMDAAFGESANLTAMYKAGQGRPVYSADKSRRNPSVDSFWFKFDNRVAAIDADWLHAFHALGLTITCPRNWLCVPPGPPVLNLTSEDPSVFGIVRARSVSGVTKDGQGRPLYGDAAHLSWLTEEAALAEMEEPASHPLLDLPADLWEFLDREDHPRCPKELRFSVGALRWKGWSEEAINDAYRLRRWTALEAHYKALLEEASRKLSTINNTHRMSSYWRNCVEDELKKLCQRAEMLQKFVPEGLDLGDLPAAVAALAEKETA
jgi:hypothetical protein